MDDERSCLWTAHCHRMAEALYSLADACDDLEMLTAYAALGARWIMRAEEAPPLHHFPIAHLSLRITV